MKNHRFKFFICSPGIIRKQVQIFSVPYEGTCELLLCRPLENQLVSAKSDAIVPRADHRKPLDNPDVLKLKIFAGEGSFTLYEDSGDGYGYTRGQYAETHFDLFRTENSFRLSCTVTGDTSFIPRNCRCEIECIGFGDVEFCANVRCESSGNTANFKSSPSNGTAFMPLPPSGIS